MPQLIQTAIEFTASMTDHIPNETIDELTLLYNEDKYPNVHMEWYTQQFY